MKRTLLALCIVALSLACKPETPGPTPEPTPIVAPTEVPVSDAACYTPGPPGSPPYCLDGFGRRVTCPVDTAGLPLCGD